jgi:hypothetical protein
MVAAMDNTEAQTTVQKLSVNAEEVREVIELEHTLTFREATSLYPKAIGWSFYFSLGVIMLGMIKLISREVESFSHFKQHLTLSFLAICTQCLHSRKILDTLSRTGILSLLPGRPASEWATQSARSLAP